jgi:omega-6 fatty acid desaturase (delta-12 desaturase)
MQNPDMLKAIERDLLPFKKRKLALVWVQIIATLFGLYGSILLGFWAISNAPILLGFSLPLTTVCMCRSYVLLHDCGHKSLFRHASLNNAIGHLMGFGIVIPHSLWKFIHDAHHKNVGNLEQRAFNPEIWTLTKKEYLAARTWKRMAYRFLRSRWIRFTLTPTINLGLIFRLVSKKYSTAANVSVVLHDAAYVLIGYVLLTFYPASMLFCLLYLPLVVFYFIASYTFYAQHQFENTYWENEDGWNYKKASFYGASCIEAPAWFRFLTGNVIYHNLHHLQSGIPFYQLHHAHVCLKEKYAYPCFSLWDVWSMLDAKVWDEDQKRLVPFPR